MVICPKCKNALKTKNLCGLAAMAKAWMGLLLLWAIASQVDGRGVGVGLAGRGGGVGGSKGVFSSDPTTDVLLLILMIAVVGPLACALCLCPLACCCMSHEIDSGNREEREKREELARKQRWEMERMPYTRPTLDNSTTRSPRQVNTITSSNASTERTEGSVKEPLLAGQTVQVQLVDEQLNDMEVPPTQVTITTLSNLLSDLAFYAGLPKVHGLLVKSQSGGYVQVLDYVSQHFDSYFDNAQVFDMSKVPRGNLKVRSVMSGNQHMLRLYPNPGIQQ